MIKQSFATEWMHCPVCGNKTRDKIREDYSYYNQKQSQQTVSDSHNSLALRLCVWLSDDGYF